MYCKHQWTKEERDWKPNTSTEYIGKIIFSFWRGSPVAADYNSWLNSQYSRTRLCICMANVVLTIFPAFRDSAVYLYGQCGTDYIPSIPGLGCVSVRPMWYWLYSQHSRTRLCVYTANVVLTILPAFHDSAVCLYGYSPIFFSHLIASLHIKFTHCINFKRHIYLSVQVKSFLMCFWTFL